VDVNIDRVELRLLRLPLVHPFETSVGTTCDRVFLLVTACGDGVAGYGECVADADPFYSPETVETAWHVLTTFLAPAVLGRSFDHPRALYGAMRQVRGHNMAKAALEMAGWDLYARQQAVPLWRVLGGTRTAIPAGVSIGIQPSVSALVQRVEREMAAGYRRAKIKIRPGWDIEPVAAIRRHLGPIALMVDANGAYTLRGADALTALDEHELMMIEQPLEYDDIQDHAALQRRLRTPICLDESIPTVRAARDAIRAGACQVINIKPGRLGGLGEAIGLHDLCVAESIAVWHGGMLESGIGRAHNLHLSTLPGFCLPGDVAASRRYYDPDLVEPSIELGADGTIDVPPGPGIGVRVVGERIDRATVRTGVLRA
jgi:O-succinylbenzoate synthase